MFVCFTDHPEAIKHINFIKYIRKNGIDPSKTKIDIYDYNYRGLSATANFKKDEAILYIPFSITLSEDDMKVTELGKVLEEKKVFTGVWKRWIYPVIFVCEEMVKPNSIYKPWIDVIPTDFSGSAYYFTPEEKEWLKGSSILSNSFY